jgi:putative FmdB family regulatory protein
LLNAKFAFFNGRIKRGNMPTYDYKCFACGEIFEAFHKITDEPLSDCLKCKAQGQVKRLISAGAGVIFKGSGFYSTDYKKTPAPNSPKPECSGCPQSGCQQSKNKD